MSRQIPQLVLLERYPVPIGVANTWFAILEHGLRICWGFHSSTVILIKFEYLFALSDFVNPSRQLLLLARIVHLLACFDLIHLVASIACTWLSVLDRSKSIKKLTLLVANTNGTALFEQLSSRLSAVHYWHRPLFRLAFKRRHRSSRLLNRRFQLLFLDLEMALIDRPCKLRLVQIPWIQHKTVGIDGIHISALLNQLILPTFSLCQIHLNLFLVSVRNRLHLRRLFPKKWTLEFGIGISANPAQFDVISNSVNVQELILQSLFKLCKLLLIRADLCLQPQIPRRSVAAFKAVKLLLILLYRWMHFFQHLEVVKMISDRRLPFLHNRNCLPLVAKIIPLWFCLIRVIPRSAVCRHPTEGLAEASRLHLHFYQSFKMTFNWSSQVLIITSTKSR